MYSIAKIEISYITPQNLYHDARIILERTSKMPIVLPIHHNNYQDNEKIKMGNVVNLQAFSIGG